MGKKSQKQKSALNLDDLREGLPGITPEFGASTAQAASVCLEGQGHSKGVELRISRSQVFAVHWTPATEQARRCWRDENEATQFGACGIAFLLTLSLTGFTVIERSRTGTGFDYWLGTDDELFQRKARLEISGILNGNKNTINLRVKQKLRQTDVSDNTRLPAYICVVEFGAPSAKVVEK
jgi:hypothetical protein